MAMSAYKKGFTGMVVYDVTDYVTEWTVEIDGHGISPPFYLQFVRNQDISCQSILLTVARCIPQLIRNSYT